METVTLDFEFNKYSPEYGYFLVACAETIPRTIVSNTSSQFFNYYKIIDLMVGVSVPEDFGVFLKLKFGKNFRLRPTPEELAILKYREEVREEESKRASFLHVDYIDILKKERYNVMNPVDRKLYDELKMISIAKPKGLL